VEQIIVGMADCRVSKTAGQVLSAYALGSCIGLSVYDPRAMVGGLLHYMLPDSAIDAGRSCIRPFMFADTGIPKLLDEVCGQGALRRRLVAHAVGGAQMINDSMTFDIGKRNCLALRKVLWKFGVLLAGEVLGGRGLFRQDVASCSTGLRRAAHGCAAVPCGAFRRAVLRSRRFRHEIRCYE